MSHLSTLRRKTQRVFVGDIAIGGDSPIVVQSMTNTDTADAEGTARQVYELAQAGSELVRITVNTSEAAQQVPRIRKMLDDMGCDVPLIGDFHYNGHRLLTEYPECAQALAKYRINPGNVGKNRKGEDQFAMMIAVAKQYDKPVRIGVNWGSLDQDLVVRLMDDNAKLAQPKEVSEVTREALIVSALQSAQRAEELGLAHDRIVLSCKVSAVQDLIAVYTELSKRCDYPLHLGLDRGGHGLQRDRCVHRCAGSVVAARHRRHHTYLADAGAEWRPHAGSRGGAGDIADHGAALLYAYGDGMSRLRAHDQYGVPGVGAGHPALFACTDAGVARTVCGCGGNGRGGYGLHR